MHAKNLIIVESPTKAKTIGKIMGKDFIVLSSMGHLVDLPRSKLGVDIDNGLNLLIQSLRAEAKSLQL